MDPEARIARMEADGVISAAQAEGLREGLSGHGGQVRRRRLPGRALALGGAALVVFLVLGAFLALTGDGGVGEVQRVAETLNRPEEIGVMNRSLATTLTILLLIVPAVAVLVWSYNVLVSKEEAVLSSWAQVESTFQRRADLVPALVENVSRFMKHERETLTAVTAERSGGLDRLAERVDEITARQARAGRPPGAEELEDQQRLTAFHESQAALGREIASFLAIAEEYPELRSADSFLELQAQLEGSENRIHVARMRFNQAVETYNGAIRRLPASLVASLGEFRRKAYFQAEGGASEAPGLDFE